MKNEGNGTKLCKHCQTEIPEKAKVCPNCRKRQGKSGCLIVVIVVVVLFVILAIAGGGGGNSSSNNDANISPDTNKTQSDADLESKNDNDKQEENVGNVEVLAEYNLADSIGWYTRHFIVIQNNSNETVDVSTSSLAYDKEGNLLGAADGSFDALGAGCTSVLYEAFEVEGEVDHYETEFNFSKSKYYKSVIQDLEYEQNDLENGAVFKVTNKGEDAAEFVEGYAMFFLGDELVGYESTYFTDDDHEIKPGKTISKQMTSYNDFDSIKFYLKGRK